MVLVGGPAMVEAVRTTQSTFGIWVIVAVAMISLAVWLVGVYVADSYQTRLSRQRRRSGVRGAWPHGDRRDGVDGGVGGIASIPGQRREAGQPEPEPASASAAASTSTSASASGSGSETGAAQGKHARPGDYYAAADYYEAADYKAAEKPPPATRRRAPVESASPRRAARRTRRPGRTCRPRRRRPAGTRCRRSAAATPTSTDADAAQRRLRPAGDADAAQRRLRPGGANLCGA